ncbi:hypothetical protein [Burkholderia multivorans]|uniref:hypothetical protein n=1 Tax=Burkholderia multivorans TaxID=87883 RepID=UPI001C22D952|nr:hypothetical protein [Burkholderia multivorans]MBU9210853.1 hypothetical protein [Burkholderia multivorans]MBU9336674.1 hypothetical protein [Burkholderia multivorans]MBU9444557.1 hypothetical protein [Burkholderia multivorans]MCA8482198.1 hypothetical protein [Burkholderia multivorans]
MRETNQNEHVTPEHIAVRSAARFRDALRTAFGATIYPSRAWDSSSRSSESDGVVVPDVRRSIEEEFATVKLADRYHIQLALEQPDTSWSFRRRAIAFFAHIVAIATAGALLWILAPHLASLVGRVVPSLEDLTDFREVVGCTAAGRDWYLVKRVLVGYAAMCVLLMGGLFVCLGVRFLILKRKRRVAS